MYQPYGGDYTAAVAGNFTFQLVMQDLNATGASLVYAALRGNTFKGGMNIAYTGLPTGRPPNVYVLAKTSMYPALYEAEALMLPDNGAARSGVSWAVTLLLTIGATAALLVTSDGKR